jgi:hypothetical protein
MKILKRLTVSLVLASFMIGFADEILIRSVILLILLSTLIKCAQAYAPPSIFPVPPLPSKRARRRPLMPHLAGLNMLSKQSVTGRISWMSATTCAFQAVPVPSIVMPKDGHIKWHPGLLRGECWLGEPVSMIKY